MAYTLGGLVTRVRQRVRDTSFSYTDIQQYLNETLNDIYNEYRLPRMLTSQTYTLNAGTSDITNGSNLPTNFVQALNLTITSSGYESVLPIEHITSIDAMYPDPDDTTINPSNIPTKAYFDGSTLRVYPAPNSAYTAKLRYYKKPTELDADADVPDLPSEFSELLTLGASYRVQQVKDNYDQAGILENKYMELLTKFGVKYAVQQVGAPTVMRINRHVVVKQNY